MPEMQTIERIPLQQPKWFACMTGPRQEAVAAAWLTRAGYYVAFPFDRFQRRRKRPHGRTIVEWIDRPHFPRYIFVALRYLGESISPVNGIKGVSRVVCRRLSGEPLQIPTSVMDAILDERLFSLDNGGIMLSETHLDTSQPGHDREVRVFLGELGRWKSEQVAA